MNAVNTEIHTFYSPTFRSFQSQGRIPLNSFAILMKLQLLFFLYMFLANQWFIFVIFSLLPLTEVSPQSSAIPGGNPPGIWQLAVDWIRTRDCMTTVRCTTIEPPHLPTREVWSYNYTIVCTCMTITFPLRGLCRVPCRGILWLVKKPMWPHFTIAASSLLKILPETL